MATPGSARRPRSFRTVVSAAVTVITVVTLLFTSAVSAPAADVGRSAAPAATELATTATVASTFDQQLVALINDARAEAGVPLLRSAGGLNSLAAWWSGRLNAGATGYRLAHNPDAWSMLPRYQAANRTTWGENVAWSSSTSASAASIFRAYMNSSGHRANILNPEYRFIGSGTRTGSRGLWNTTEFTDRVQDSQVAPVAEGEFVFDEGSRKYYRIAGGAPLLITSFTPFGGNPGAHRLTAAEFAKLRKYPRDGTYVADRRTGVVYRFAGGAPIFVSKWANVGGRKPVVYIDGAAIRYAGRGGAHGEWNHVRWYPADNTYLIAHGHGAVFRVVGGKARYLPSWASVGGVKPTVAVDRMAIERAGSGGAYNHLK